MKSSIALVFLVYIALAIGYPTHNGMFYYQMPSYYNAPRQQHPYQQAMFVHYTEPQYPGYPTTYQGRSTDTNGVSTFTAGDTIAAGSILKDCVHHTDNVHKEAPASVEQTPIAYDEVASDGDGGIHAIAEAYPHAPEEPDANDEPQVYISETNEVIPTQSDDDDQNVAQPEIQNQKSPTIVKLDEPAVLEIVTTEEPAKTTVAPVALPPRKKKVYVALAPPRGTFDDDDDEPQDDEAPFYYKPQKRKNQAQAPLSIFPLTFGHTYGGAIAVANAFSTSKGGATSHAIAYGSPAPKKAYKRIVQQ